MVGVHAGGATAKHSTCGFDYFNAFNKGPGRLVWKFRKSRSSSSVACSCCSANQSAISISIFCNFYCLTFVNSARNILLFLWPCNNDRLVVPHANMVKMPTLDCGAPSSNPDLDTSSFATNEKCQKGTAIECDRGWSCASPSIASPIPVLRSTVAGRDEKLKVRPKLSFIFF